MKKINYFPSNLRFLLKKQGFSQASFGNTLNKDRTTVGIWVKGTSGPDHATTISIADILEVNLNDLLLLDMTSENYSLKEPESLKVAEVQHEYGENLKEPITDLVVKVVAIAVKPLREEIRELKKDLIVDKETKTQIQYIYDALQKAELTKEIKETLDKIKEQE